MLGLPNSTVQCLTPPFSSGTSISMYACGLVHWKVVTDPFKVTVLDWSNMANEWCAVKMAGAVNMPNARINRPQTLVRASDMVSLFLPELGWNDRCGLGLGQVRVQFGS